jgi:8-oxo-dGTP diphosphatase
MPSVVRVTCAIIIDNDLVFAARRSDKMDLPGKWEFPGGKVLPNERDEDCLKREILEELGVEIDILNHLRPSEYEYPHKSICLIPMLCSIKGGEISAREHAEVGWFTKMQLTKLDWAEADIPILKEFLSRV